MSLERQVDEAMEAPLRTSDPVIERMVHGDRPVTDDEMFTLLSRQIAGLKRAIRLLAREVDEMRDA